MTKEIAKTGNNKVVAPNSVSYDMVALKEVAAMVKASDLTPLETESQIMIAMLTGKELGLPPMASVQNIYSIQGKAGQTIHLMIGLMLKNGITYDIIKDFETEVTYSDAHGTKYPEEIAKSKLESKEWTSILRSDLKDAAKKAAAIIPGKKCLIVDVDTVTKVIAHRIFPDGRKMDIPFTYALSEARNSGLIKEGSMWQKRPKIMCLNRALSGVFRLIGDDYLLGLNYEATELMDGAGITYDVNENDEIVVHDVEVVVESQNETKPEEKNDKTSEISQKKMK